MSVGVFDGMVSFLNKVMDIRSKRHETFLSNIANQNTPGYKAKGVDFKNALKSAISEQGVKKMNTTNSRHMPGSSFEDLDTLVVEINAPSGLDGNNVNPEMEMARMSENSIMYNANATFLKKNFQMLRSAIRGR